MTGQSVSLVIHALKAIYNGSPFCLSVLGSMKDTGIDKRRQFIFHSGQLSGHSMVIE